MNYKTLTLEQILQIYPAILDSLSDNDAFDLMQRYNELVRNEPINTDMYSNLELKDDCMTTFIEEDNQEDYTNDIIS